MSWEKDLSDKDRKNQVASLLTDSRLDFFYGQKIHVKFPSGNFPRKISTLKIIKIFRQFRLNYHLKFLDLIRRELLINLKVNWNLYYHTALSGFVFSDSSGEIHISRPEVGITATKVQL